MSPDYKQLLEDILQAFERKGLVALLRQENLQFIRELNTSGETDVALEQLFLLIDELLITLPTSILADLESLNEIMKCGLDFRGLQNIGLEGSGSQEGSLADARHSLLQVLGHVAANRKK